MRKYPLAPQTLDTLKAIRNISLAVVLHSHTSLASSLTKRLPGRCIWNALYVYIYPLWRFAGTLLRMFIFPGGSFQSLWIEEYVLLYYLYRKSVLRLSYHSFVRDMAAIARQFEALTFATEFLLKKI